MGGFLSDILDPIFGDDDQESSGTQTVENQPGPYPEGGEKIWETFMDSLLGAEEFTGSEFDEDWYLNQKFYSPNNPNPSDGWTDREKAWIKDYGAERHYEDYGQYEGRFRVDPDKPLSEEGEGGILELLTEQQEGLAGDFSTYEDALNQETGAYSDLLQTAPQGYYGAIEQSKANPLNISIGGKNITSVYPQGRINTEKEKMNTALTIGQNSLVNNLLAPEARWNFQQQNPTNKAQLDFFDILSKMALGQEALRYSIPSSTESAELQSPGASGLENLGGIFDIVGKSFNLFGK